MTSDLTIHTKPACATSEAPLFVRKNQHLYRLDFADILYVQSDGNYSFLHTREESRYVVKISLRKLQELLPENFFFRIHKSYLIHLDYLQEIDLNERMAIVAGQPIPIGRTYIQELTRTLKII